MTWTLERIGGLAPNASTERRARTLANSSKWLDLGQGEDVLWGVCKGSGSQPYQSQIDLRGPAFKCSCPVRQPPCKHVLALFFLYVQESSLFEQTNLPTWVSTWLERRRAVQSSSESKEKTAEEQNKADKAKAKRAEAKLDLRIAGMEELELWLEDIMRQGLANVESKKSDFWYTIAAKMMDAQLPKLSTFLKESYDIAVKSDQWIEQLSMRLAYLYLLVEAFKKRETLEEGLQLELFNALGENHRKRTVVEEELEHRDHWLILGQKEDIDVEGRSFRKVWVYGLERGQQAYLLDFSFGGQAYEEQYITGMVYEGLLHYYPHNFPQRALLLKEGIYQQPYEFTQLVSSFIENFSKMKASLAQALKKNPWLRNYAVLLKNIQLIKKGEGDYVLRDNQKGEYSLPLLPQATILKIYAITGGDAFQLFAQWNSLHLEPISILHKEKIIQL